jgi:PAS domain-containing protein
MKMSKSRVSEDPFFTKMRLLTALMLPNPNVPVNENASHIQTHPHTPITTIQRNTRPSDFSECRQDYDLVRDLQSKVQSAEATAEKERLLRLTVEQERDEILFECRESKRLFESPFQGDVMFLKEEARRQLASRIDERKKHLKEMDNLHLQKQQAVSQRDSMEARLLGSLKTIDELEVELTRARGKIQEYVAASKESTYSEPSTSRQAKRDRSENELSLSKGEAVEHGMSYTETAHQPKLTKFSNAATQRKVGGVANVAPHSM